MGDSVKLHFLKSDYKRFVAHFATFIFVKVNLHFENGTTLFASNQALDNSLGGRAAIQIGGHTDKSGGDKINFPLSVSRAEKVKQYFLDKGIATERVFAFGYASTYPLVPNDTKEHRAMNRRTEIRFQKR